MGKYRVNVNISEEAMDVIFTARMKLGFIRTVEGHDGETLIWATKFPFMKNTIEWTDEYLWYSSRKILHEDDDADKRGIRQDHIIEASDQVIYEYEEFDFHEKETDERVGVREYAVHNGLSYLPKLTFGLAAWIRINDFVRTANSINAFVLPYEQSIVVKPSTKVKMFLAPDIEDGMIVTEEYKNGIMVEFDENETEKSFEYDVEKGMFVQVENPSHEEEDCDDIDDEDDYQMGGFDRFDRFDRLKHFDSEQYDWLNRI